MSKIGIIIEREYLRRVSKKSFILLTIFLPILFVALIFVPLWLSSIKGSETYNIAILDSTNKYAHFFEDTGNFHFLSVDSSLETYRHQTDKEIYAFLSITEDLLQNPNAATLYSEKQIPGELSRLVNQTLTQALEKEKLATFNIPNLQEIIKESQVTLRVNTVKWTQAGTAQASSSTVASVVGGLFTFIIYLFIMLYGAMVMQGVMEEKANRIIELIISSVKPFELMMGKIIGILFVGLTQVVIWLLITGGLFMVAQLLLGGGMDAALAERSAMTDSIGGMSETTLQESSQLLEFLQTVNMGEILLFFLIYFIGGYMLYASLFAAIGSAIDHQEDTQQFMAPITLFMLFAFYAGIYSLENPDGPLAFWCSMIPFTSPIVMMIRIPFDVPLWEQMVSVLLLYTTSLSITWISAKIYRVGILMYGKKPSIKEIIKWIKYN